MLYKKGDLPPLHLPGYPLAQGLFELLQVKREPRGYIQISMIEGFDFDFQLSEVGPGRAAPVPGHAPGQTTNSVSMVIVILYII